MTDSLEAALEEMKRAVAICAAKGGQSHGMTLDQVEVEALAAYFEREKAAMTGASTDAAPVAGVSADLLTKAVGDITAALIMAGQQNKVSEWTAPYVAAINEHDAHPPVPDAAGEDAALLADANSWYSQEQTDEIARIIAEGYHGHPWWWKDVFDDGADQTAARLREEDCSVANNVIAALAQPPAAEPVKAIALGRKLDAEDGGYPAPAAEPAPATFANVTVSHGPCQHRWAHAPTVGYYQCIDCLERHEHGSDMYRQIEASFATGNGGEGRSLTVPVLNPIYAEDHPLLAPIIEKRARAAGNFSPEFSGQRGEDFDRGLLCAFEAVNGELQRMTTALASKPGGEGDDGE
ncbi:hypothetical protein SAMIE_1015790 [Sphingobium amiense]|uniref:Uncharacterized protein n=1 Tax=Sphingobium amiense TaxID=135719 RepID=A0A494W4H9_9SPHN|nr:hypothetical protein [Sphingobium amiense]BBD98078.1 hypothetical protein SAMIE_1015790 [Sphingobium amiense]